MYILHLSVLLTAGPSTAVYCCQQDPAAVLDPSLLGLTLLPDPMMMGLGDQQRWAQQPARPTAIGYYCQQDPATVGLKLQAGPPKVGSCCHQDPVALAGSISFEIRVCNWAGGNRPHQVNPNLGDPTKTWQSPFFFFLQPRDPSFFIFFN